MTILTIIKKPPQNHEIIHTPRANVPLRVFVPSWFNSTKHRSEAENGPDRPVALNSTTARQTGITRSRRPWPVRCYRP